MQHSFVDYIDMCAFLIAMLSLHTHFQEWFYGLKIASPLANPWLGCASLVSSDDELG